VSPSMYVYCFLRIRHMFTSAMSIYWWQNVCPCMARYVLYLRVTFLSPKNLDSLFLGLRPAILLPMVIKFIVFSTLSLALWTFCKHHYHLMTVQKSDDRLLVQPVNALRQCAMLEQTGINNIFAYRQLSAVSFFSWPFLMNTNTYKTPLSYQYIIQRPE